MGYVAFGFIMAIMLSVIIGVFIHDFFTSEEKRDFNYYFLTIWLYLIFMLLFSVFPALKGLNIMDKNARIEGVREYLENPSKFKVSNKTEVDYNIETNK